MNSYLSVIYLVVLFVIIVENNNFLGSVYLLKLPKPVSSYTSGNRTDSMTIYSQKKDNHEFQSVKVMNRH